jgi:hypothetical protein
MYCALGNHARAELLFQEMSASRTIQSSPEDPTSLNFKEDLGTLYEAQGKHDRAEPLLRDCLALRQKQQLNNWRTFSIQSTLGGSLQGQKRYAEAEPLLIAGYEGMKRRADAVPLLDKERFAEALQRLVQLYDGWGKKEKADEWRKKLEETNAIAKPPAKP